MVVQAELDVAAGRSGRRSSRRNITLRVPGSVASGEAHEVLIHNLSETGVLLETDAELPRGQEIVIELPGVPARSARVVWNSDGMFGCEFDKPLSTAAVSAAQLRSAPEQHRDELPAPAPSTPSLVDPATFGDRLRSMRKAMGLSLVEFARRAQVSRPTVWSWEAGKTVPRQSKIPVLLEVLGVSAGELLGSEDSRTSDTIDKQEALSSRLHNVVKEAKARVAEVAGTTAEKVKLVIEM